MLSDATEDLMGNLTVYPGSHHILEEVPITRRRITLPDYLQVIREAGGPDGLFNRTGFENPADPQSESLKLVKQRASSRMGKPVQVKGKKYVVVESFSHLGSSCW